MAWPASKTSGVSPRARRCAAAASPMGPAPMMTIGRLGGICSLSILGLNASMGYISTQKNLPARLPRPGRFADHTLVLHQALRDLHPGVDRHLKGRAPAVGDRVDLALSSMDDFCPSGH